MPYILQKSASGSHFIEISNEAGLALKTRFGSNRLLVSIGQNAPIHAALLSKPPVDFYVHVGKMTCQKLKIKAGDLLEIEFAADDSEFQFEMPEAFQEVLDSDEEASEIFQKLTDGNKRSLIYLVNSVKSVDKKIERALKIAEKIKAGITNAQKIMKP
jgi:hypothetical protein